MMKRKYPSKIAAGTCIAVATLLFATMPTAACKSAASMTHVLLQELPAAARNEPVVARVRIIEAEREPWISSTAWVGSSRVKLEVVDAIRGVQKGQIIIAQSHGSSCDQHFTQFPSPADATAREIWRPFIAGNFEQTNLGEQIFRGDWRTNGEKKVR